MDVLQRFMELSVTYPDIHDAFRKLYTEISMLNPTDFDKAFSTFVDLYHSGDTQPQMVEESSPELNKFLSGFKVLL